MGGGCWVQAADEQRWNAGINGQVVVRVELGAGSAKGLVGTGPPGHLGVVGRIVKVAGAGQGGNRLLGLASLWCLTMSF